MRDGWIETKLVDAVEVLDRFRKPINSTERQLRQGSVPYYGANGQAGWIDDSIFNEELVLLGEDAIDFADPNARKAYLISGPSWVNNHAHVLRAKPEKVYSYFLAESLNTVDYSQYVSFGTRSKLTQGSMNGIKVLLPPLREQKRIVNLISSVDSYIEALQQQLEIVKRSRNAVLHELLTAGGDDWVETTLGNVCDFVNGDRGKNYPSAKFRQSHGIPFINAGHLDKGIVNFDSMDFISEEVFQKLGSGKVQPGDTLFCLRGSVGKFANVEDLQKGAIASSLVIIRPNSQITREFLMHYLDSDLCSSELKQSLTGAVQPNLSANNLKSFKISLPTLGKQIEIGDLLGQFNSSITAVSSLLESTRNLRSGILSDLLSGKHEIPASYDKVIGAA